MARRGRRPTRSKLVDRLEGGEREKERLRAILGTLSGEWTVVEAAQRLGVNLARFHQLRTRLLQEALTGLEPRPPGRKPKLKDPRDLEIERLEGELDRLQRSAKAMEIRAELALAGIGTIGTPAGSKKRSPRRS